MNIASIDVVFIVILSALVANGTSKGFIALFLGKAAFWVSFVVGIILNNFVATILSKWIPIVLVTKVLAFILLFILTYVIIKLVEKILGWIFKGEILKSLDRSLGLLFGLLEGVLLVILILLILNVQPWVDVGGLLQDSIFNKIFIGPMNQLLEFVSQGIGSNV